MPEIVVLDGGPQDGLEMAIPVAGAQEIKMPTLPPAFNVAAASIRPDDTITTGVLLYRRTSRTRRHLRVYEWVP